MPNTVFHRLETASWFCTTCSTSSILKAGPSEGGGGLRGSRLWFGFFCSNPGLQSQQKNPGLDLALEPTLVLQLAELADESARVGWSNGSVWAQSLEVSRDTTLEMQQGALKSGEVGRRDITGC